MFKRHHTPAAQARKVLGALWDGYLPVDLDTIAKMIGLHVVPDETLAKDGYSGVYEGPEGGNVIRINPFESSQRRRFTLAHEIGHHIMQHGARLRDPVANFSMSADPIEREANQFAAELLMPEEAVRQLVRIDRIHDLSTLAQRFNVSEAAMHYRLKNLRII